MDAACRDDRAVREHDLGTEHVRGGRTPANRMRSTCVVRGHPAEGARSATSRIRREEESLIGKSILKIEVHEARLDDRLEVAAVYLDDPAHARERDDDATFQRDGAAGLPGPGAARHDRCFGLIRDADDRDDLGGRLRHDDRARCAPLAQRPERGVVGIRKQRRGIVDDPFARYDLAQSRRDARGADRHRPYARDIALPSTHVSSEDLATCISCGLCLNDCPTYRVLGDEADSPRGRIQLIRTVVASPAAPSDTTVDHLEACLVCRACETACPSGVPFGRIMEGAREVLREREDGGLGDSLGRTALDTVAHRGRLAWFTRLTDLARRVGLLRLSRALGGRIAWAASLAPAREGPSFEGIDRPGATTALFAGC